MTEPLLELADVSAGYGDTPVLKAINLRLEAGEVVAVVGSNGAGKTTLLRAVSGFEASVTTGTVNLFGRNAAGLSVAGRARAGLGHVPDGRALHGGLTTREHLVMGGLTLRRRDAERRVDELMQQFPVLASRAKQHATELSGGEQQILAIARALMMAPSVLLLDEPCTGLAPLIVAQVMDIVADLRESGTSVLLVEQNVTAALGVADRAVVLEQGAVVTRGSAEEIGNDESLVDSYLGGPATDLAGAR